MDQKGKASGGVPKGVSSAGAGITFLDPSEPPPIYGRRQRSGLLTVSSSACLMMDTCPEWNNDPPIFPDDWSWQRGSIEEKQPFPMDTGITQIPKYLVMGMGNKKSLECEQHLRHNAMFWYKQSAQKPLELMFVYNFEKLSENNTVPSRFSPECPDSSSLKLHVDAPEPEDSATYLCASSKERHSPAVAPPPCAQTPWVPPGSCWGNRGPDQHFL
ncbi:hypothetical protein MC885_012886 [Smutsia gigantea]|nr:hypothetical protein MC885_012886 [Smutsia gigantea]